MRNKTYYIYFYDPAQPMCYRLYYLFGNDNKDLLPEGVYQISRKNAEQLVRNERTRRKRHRPAAGLSDDAIFPGWIPDARERIADDPGFYLSKCIWLPKETESNGQA